MKIKERWLVVALIKEKPLKDIVFASLSLMQMTSNKPWFESVFIFIFYFLFFFNYNL